MSTILLPRTSRSILRSVASRSLITGISFCCTSMTTRKASARVRRGMARDYTMNFIGRTLSPVHFARVHALRPPAATHRHDHSSDRPADRVAERQHEHGSASAVHRRRDFRGGMAAGEKGGVVMAV